MILSSLNPSDKLHPIRKDPKYERFLNMKKWAKMKRVRFADIRKNWVFHMSLSGFRDQKISEKNKYRFSKDLFLLIGESHVHKPFDP